MKPRSMPIAIAHDFHVEEPVTISTVREVRQRQRCQGDGEPDRDGGSGLPANCLGDADSLTNLLGVLVFCRSGSTLF